MFSKLTPASLCVCDRTSDSRKYFTPAKMIDTQLKREPAPAAIIACVQDNTEHKMAAAPRKNNTTRAASAADAEEARVNTRNARNKQDRQDINCNTMEKQQQQQDQVNRVMSVANGNGKRSPKSLDIRKEEVMAIRNRFPTKVPIIVQRFCKETSLPQLDKSKYLVPQEITMSQFLTIIRNRMRISSTQTLYLLVNNRSMISLSLTLAEVYNEYAGTDGFLYVTYASQEVFGCGADALTVRMCTRVDNEAHETSTSNKHEQQQQEQEQGHDQLSVNVVMMNAYVANESHLDAFLDNTYKSMCFG